MARSAHALRILLAVTLPLALAACGGSGSGSVVASGGGGPSDGSALTGILSAEGPIGGVAYQTATQHGVTGADGSFRYREGEQVAFSIGALLLGEAVAAQAAMSPLELVPGSAIPTTIHEVRDFLDEYRGGGEELADFGSEPTGSWFPIETPRFLLLRSHATRRMVNMLRLLRAFDRDKDPSNGITIHEAASSAFADASLDLDLPFGPFKVALRRRLFAAFHAGAVPSAMQDANWGLALDAFARARNVSPPVFADREVRRDDSRRVETKRFDVRGLLVSEARFVDDVLDVSVERTYDDWGNQLTWRWTGRGTTFATRFRYDDHGSLVYAEQERDGLRTSSLTNTYDASGRRQTEAFDSDGDGRPDGMLAREFDREGRVAGVSASFVGVPQPQVFRFQYDTRGRISQIGFDADNDRVEESTVVLTYDERGHLVHEAWQGSPAAEHQRTFDAAGRLSRLESDLDADGAVDRTESITFDARGYWTSIDIREDGPEQRFEQAHDRFGNRVRGEYTVDGRLQYVTTTRVDAQGHPIRIEMDTTGDGVANLIHQMTNNSEGYVTRRETDLEGDGIIDVTSFRDPVRVSFATFAEDGAREYGALELMRTVAQFPR